MRAREVMMAVVLGALGTPRLAHADEPWMLSLEGSAAAPVSAPQLEWFQPGGSVAATLWRSLASPVALGARARGVLLGDGPPPADATLADPGVGGVAALTLGGRLRLEPLWDESPRRATGPWIDAFGGAALTGAALRPTVELGAGWNIPVGDVDLGPSVRWAMVLETESQLESRPAHLIVVGVEVVLFDARPREDAPPAEPARTPAPADLCPDEAEDEDGFQDEDGCPDPDDDLDGVPDADDACPRAPEDRDGVADGDGCPEEDADRDAIVDADDACPEARETVNGIDDADGCPDAGLIELVDDRVILDERVLFDLERARVRHRALPALRAIVQLWRQHPEWRELRVEGHADLQGSREFNQRLSEHRAERVRSVLVELGIPDAIITSAGYGELRPRARGDDPATHQQNRRVEFVVVRSAPRADEGSSR